MSDISLDTSGFDRTAFFEFLGNAAKDAASIYKDYSATQSANNLAMAKLRLQAMGYDGALYTEGQPYAGQRIAGIPTSTLLLLAVGVGLFMMVKD